MVEIFDLEPFVSKLTNKSTTVNFGKRFFQLISYSANLIKEKLKILKMMIRQFHFVAKD